MDSGNIPIEIEIKPYSREYVQSLSNKEFRRAYQVCSEQGLGDLGDGCAYGQILVDEAIRRAGSLEEVTDWVESKKEKQFIELFKNKHIKYLDDAVPYIQEYIGLFNTLEVYLGYQKVHGSSSGDGGIFAKSIFKTLDSNLEGKEIGYDNFRDLMDNFGKDFFDILVDATKPSKAKHIQAETEIAILYGEN